jgi:hypothetical protein
MDKLGGHLADRTLAFAAGWDTSADKHPGYWKNGGGGGVLRRGLNRRWLSISLPYGVRKHTNWYIGTTCCLHLQVRTLTTILPR